MLGFLKRRLLFPVVIATSVGVPYAFWNDGLHDSITGKWQNWTTANSVKTTTQLPSIYYTPELESNLLGGSLEDALEIQANALSSEKMPPLTGETVQDLAEVLRFDISPRWVMDRWARVSTIYADWELKGLRVPLVTGTKKDDLAGSLTYFFDKQHQVRRITFHGFTGDEKKLIDLVSNRFGLRGQATLDAALYLAKWNGRATSVLRISHAPVIRADMPNSRLAIMMEINRPDKRYGLSPTFQAVLKNDRHSRRW